jgi:putative ABC transport system permease protein
VMRSYSRPDSISISKMDAFRATILSNPAIINSTTTSNIPGRENEWIGRLKRVDDPNDKEVLTSRTRVDLDFIKTYGLELLAGRNFSDETKHHAILNESAVRVLGYTNPADALGTMIMRDFEIIGVVRDFHERGLQEAIMPSFYTTGQGYTKFITVHLNTSDLSTEIAFLERQWKSVFPDRPFDYFFLDDFFNQQYKREAQLTRIIACFSILGIFVACLGLFGFTYFMVHQRIKEIGIRKVLGATAVNLLKLLYSEFFWLLIMAGLLAAPLAYWLTDNWLAGYAYRISLNPMHLLFPVAVVSFIAFLTIGALLWRAIRTNPTESLKYE